ncbi:hypothetical protein BDN70DRAFT_165323 [Pholiota conissans]|uniref:Uncharacterized protein n=1 Tax=Pholiota conissans TaxID=109636 RepID=A0A9P5YVM4_9AGAR|nr:hypothetical protein BDN70DRAFT_165323 [Pholiota conissans]
MSKTRRRIWGGASIVDRGMSTGKSLGCLERLRSPLPLKSSLLILGIDLESFDNSILGLRKARRILFVAVTFTARWSTGSGLTSAWVHSSMFNTPSRRSSRDRLRCRRCRRSLWRNKRCSWHLSRGERESLAQVGVVLRFDTGVQVPSWISKPFRHRGSLT